MTTDDAAAQARALVEDWDREARDPGPIAHVEALRALLVALDAAEAARDDYADRLGNVKRQRDQARREATHWEQRATRLAALHPIS